MNFLEKSKQNLEEYKRVLNENKVYDPEAREWVDEDKFFNIAQKYSKYPELRKKIEDMALSDDDYYRAIDSFANSDTYNKKKDSAKEAKKSSNAKNRKKDIENELDEDLESSQENKAIKSIKTIYSTKLNQNFADGREQIEKFVKAQKNGIIAIDLDDTEAQLLNEKLSFDKEIIKGRDTITDNDNIVFLIKTSPQDSWPGSNNENNVFKSATIYRFQGFDGEFSDEIKKLVPSDSFKKLGASKKDSSQAGATDATTIQEIIQGALIERNINKLQDVKPPYIHKGTLLYLNPEVFENKLRKTKFLSLGIDESYEIGFEKFTKLNFNLEANKYAVVHPDLKPEGIYIEQTLMSEPDLDYLFGKDIADKDDVAPADVYIVDRSKVASYKISETLQKLYNGKNRDQKCDEIVKFTNEHWFDKTIMAVSLKKSADPALDEIINTGPDNTTASLPDFKVTDITHIDINPYGNSEIVFTQNYSDNKSSFAHHFSKFGKDNNVSGFFEFRSKDSGKTWQCNVNVKGSKDAIMGGSAKNNIKSTFNFSGINDLWDQVISDADINKMKEVEKFIETLSKSKSFSIENYNSLSLKDLFTYPQSYNSVIAKKSLDALEEYVLNSEELKKHRSSPSSMRGRVGLFRFLYALAISSDRDESFQDVLRKSFKLSKAVQNSYKIF